MGAFHPNLLRNYVLQERNHQYVHELVVASLTHFQGGAFKRLFLDKQSCCGTQTSL